LNIKKFKERFKALVAGNNRPEQIALGVAIGVFIGITPTYGFHIWIALLTALSIPKINKVAVLLGTQISTPLTAPFICWINYRIGRLIVQDTYPQLSLSVLKDFNYERFLDIFIPLLAGSLVFGSICFMVSYHITKKIAYRIKAKGDRI
jgi:hypothetical protein